MKRPEPVKERRPTPTLYKEVENFANSYHEPAMSKPSHRQPWQSQSNKNK